MYCSQFCSNQIPEQTKKYQPIGSNNYYVNKSYLLGEGAFGKVYKAYNTKIKQQLAAKVIEQTKIRKYEISYQKQFQTMSRIDNPNVIRFYHWEQVYGQGIFLFIQYCPGKTLKQLIGNSQLSQYTVFQLFRGLVNGMISIHQQKIIHRDLKPQNLLLTSKNQLKIGDFGVSRFYQKEGMSMFVGTEYYRAPQVEKSPNYNQKCDVWSAGMILYQMLTGGKLFKKTEQKVKFIKDLEKKDSVIEMKNQVHKNWIQIIKKTIVFDPSQRLSFKQIKRNYLQKMELQLRDSCTYSAINTEADSVQMISMQQLSNELRKNQSMKNIQRCRKWFCFVKKKLSFYTDLCKLLQYYLQNLSNVQKSILMYLVINIYICKLEGQIRELNNKEVTTPFKKICQENIWQAHILEYNEMINKQLGRIEQKKKRYTMILKDNILQQAFRDKYEKRPSDIKTLQQYPFITRLIRSSYQGNIKKQGIYLNQYHKILDLQPFYITDIKLTKLSLDELKTYALVRTLKYIDYIMPETKYEDFLQPQIEHILKSEDLPIILAYISKYNQKF